jgi:hypothetical protein
MRYSITLKLFFFAGTAAGSGSAQLLQVNISPAHSHKIGVNLINSLPNTLYQSNEFDGYSLQAD